MKRGSHGDDVLEKRRKRARLVAAAAMRRQYEEWKKSNAACGADQYFDAAASECIRCSKCRHGEQVVMECSDVEDTQCEQKWKWTAIDIERLVNCSGQDDVAEQLHIAEDLWLYQHSGDPYEVGYFKNVSGTDIAPIEDEQTALCTVHCGSDGTVCNAAGEDREDCEGVMASNDGTSVTKFDWDSWNYGGTRLLRDDVNAMQKRKDHSDSGQEDRGGPSSTEDSDDY